MADLGEYCNNCKRIIRHNASLHILHCAKNLKLCRFCEEPVPLIDVEKHMKSKHTIEVCKHCKKPTEKWKLEEHENTCVKKPVECKFCNLSVAADDFQGHSDMCWNRTEKCSTCSQYIKLKDLEIHEKICKDSSKLGYAECKFCHVNFPYPIIDSHESICGDKTTRCPDCGDKIKKYKNDHSCRAKKKYSSSSANARSKEVYPTEEKQESSSKSSRDKYRSLPTVVNEPPNHAVEISPPVQRDFSADSKSNRVFEKESGNLSDKCKWCNEHLVPAERRIHPQICRMRIEKCVYCEEDVPHSLLNPELHNCRVYIPMVYNNQSGLLEQYSNCQTENDAVGYCSTSNSSRDNMKIDTQDCPLCSKTFPVDRFNTHVRACAENKRHCYLCKKDFFGDQKEHFMKCQGKEPNKKKEKQKKKEEKKEPFWSSIPYFGRRAKNFESKSSSDFMTAENQNGPVVSLVPCEFCNEVYPFEDIILHESGCHKYEVSPAKEQRKEPLKEPPKEEVLQASGFTPVDYTKYMLTDSHENTDRPTRNKRSSNEFYEEKSKKMYDHQSAMHQDFYEKYLVKDHEKSIPAEKCQNEPRRGVEEEKKKDVLFTFSSERKKEFSVKENRIEQGVRPKNKGRYHLSDSDEETIPYQNKEKYVGAENIIKDFPNSSLGSMALSAIGSEREQKKYGLESNQDKTFSSDNDRISSASQEAHDVEKKKGSFNSENTGSSEDVYVSCDEGEEFPETDQLNMEELTKEKHSNTIIGGRKLSKEKDSSTNYEMSNYGLGAINSDEKLASHSNTIQDHIHPFRATDDMESNAPFFVIHNPLSSKESSSLLDKLVINMDDLESEADKKNEETFASDVLVDANFNPFEAMSNSQFSYETVSSLPPYSTVNSDLIDLSSSDMKSDENLDAYLQFLGVSESETDVSCRLFENYQSGENTYGHELKPAEADPSNRLQFGANGSSTHVREAKPTSLQLKQKVLVEDLKGVSKNMPSYTSPFLLENESEEVEPSNERNFPVSFQTEKKIEENGQESKIEVKAKSKEEKDNEENWRIWRSPRQIDSESDE